MAFVQKRSGKRLPSIKQRAKQAYKLGMMHMHGRGVPKDSYKALGYLLWAADHGKHAKAKTEVVNYIKRDVGDKGCGEAAYSVARMYLKGDGVPQSITKAVNNLVIAASAGHIQAKFELGMHHWVRVPDGHKEALRLVREAADQGLGAAQYQMGVWSMTKTGLNLSDADFKCSVPNAFRYYLSAAEQGLEGAQYALSTFYRYGKAVPVDKVKATELLTRAADGGHARAQYELALELQANDGKQAVEYLHMAARQKFPLAQVQLGIYLAKGQYVARNAEEAFRLFRQAAEHKCLKAMFCMGMCYQTGQGVPCDLAKGTNYLHLAARLGNVGAQNNAGLSFLHAFGTDRDERKGFELVRQSAEAGCGEAQTNLGVCYFRGVEGVPMDHDQALHWWRRAVRQGFAEAQSNIDIYDYVNDTKQLELLYLIVFVGESGENVRAISSHAHQDFVKDFFTVGDLRKSAAAKRYSNCACCHDPAQVLEGFEVLDPSRSRVPRIVNLAVVPRCTKTACTTFAQARMVSNLTRIAGGVPKGTVCGNCCKKAPGLGLCQGCEIMRYCNPTCQKSHWLQHKSDCLLLRRQFVNVPRVTLTPQMIEDYLAGSIAPEHVVSI